MTWHVILPPLPFLSRSKKFHQNTTLLVDPIRYISNERKRIQKIKIFDIWQVTINKHYDDIQWVRKISYKITWRLFVLYVMYIVHMLHNLFDEWVTNRKRKIEKCSIIQSHITQAMSRPSLNMPMSRVLSHLQVFLLL